MSSPMRHFCFRARLSPGNCFGQNPHARRWHVAGAGAAVKVNWGGGYNVSREVLIAIRQGNDQRVEDLVEGLVSALRAQRGAARVGSVEGGLWDGLELSLGASIWDLACAAHKLSKRPLGVQRGPFWEEFSGLVVHCGSTVSARELAVLLNAYATGAPEWLAGQPGAVLGARAGQLADELMERDLVMIVHGLGRGAHAAQGLGAAPPWEPSHVQALAHATRRLDLQGRRRPRPTDVESVPQQVSLLLNGFVRLRHTQDAELFGELFGVVRGTLGQWDSRDLGLFLNAFAGAGRQARSRTTEAGWAAIADRCTNIVQGARTQDFSKMAHGLTNVGVDEPSVVSGFFDVLERLLCSRPRINDFLSAQEIALLAHAFARHRRPYSQQQPQEEETEEAAAASAASRPGTSWPFEEYAFRHLRAFTLQGLAMTLHASVRLNRGGATLFGALAAQVKRKRHQEELLGPGLALLCSSAAEAIPAIGPEEPMGLLAALLGDCQRLAPSLSPWQVVWTLTALASASRAAEAAAVARGAARTESTRLWRGSSSGHSGRVLASLCSRAAETISDPVRLELLFGQVSCIGRAEGLPEHVLEDLRDVLVRSPK